jgi:peptide/nickel transport system ATP-binding protein
VELGPAEQILEKPRHPYTRALLSVVPEAQEMKQEILVGEAPDPTLIPTGCRFHPRCPVLQDGRAEKLGVAGRCQHEDVALGEVEPGRAVACHAVAVRLDAADPSIARAPG